MNLCTSKAICRPAALGCCWQSVRCETTVRAIAVERRGNPSNPLFFVVYPAPGILDANSIGYDGTRVPPVHGWNSVADGAKGHRMSQTVSLLEESWRTLRASVDARLEQYLA